MGNASDPKNNIPTPGLTAFDSLRAEDEPWLEHCFVPPPEFDLITGARSVVVFGESGSGKTALYQALRRRLSPADARPTRLSFEWRPMAGIPPEVEINRLLTAAAETLLSCLVAWPSFWSEAPDHDKATLTWFICHYLSNSLPPLLDDLRDKTDETDQALLQELASSTVQSKYLDSASPEQVIAELTKSLPKIGLTGVCVLIGPDDLGDLESAGDSLADFLSTLRLFENSRFIYKLVLPTDLEPSLSKAGGVVRRRLDRYRLRWLEHSLASIVERRFWLASAGDVERLEEACEDKEIVTWLARCGGTSPRGWLDQARPLVAHYLDLNHLLTSKEWRQVRRMHPPFFWLNEEQKQVTVGHRQIQNIPDVEWAVLRYLYQHRDQICSRDELYHEAHLPVSGATGANQRFSPKEYEGALNNALLRLRQTIEPDPGNPLFVVTYKGKGVKLELV
jgi:DNA-binding winged helix-turn-helix (wHTH) protein